MQSACTLSMRTEIGSTMGKKISYTDEEVKSRLSCFVALCNNISAKMRFIVRLTQS